MRVFFILLFHFDFSFNHLLFQVLFYSFLFLTSVIPVSGKVSVQLAFQLITRNQIGKLLPPICDILIGGFLTTALCSFTSVLSPLSP